jgi:hypothetical protein
MSVPIDVQEVFCTTQSLAGVGVPLTSVQPGSSSTLVFGSVGFAFQDVNGNVVLPMLDAQGRIKVTTDAVTYVPSRAHGRVAGALAVTGANDYTNYQTVLSVPAVAASGYGAFNGKVTCRRDALFQLVYSDVGGSLVVLDSTILGPGEFSAPIGVGSDYFMVPASANTPVFQVRAVNLGTVSDLSATLAVLPF